MAATGGPLLVAYDGDQAGREATLRAADLLGGLDAHVMRLPEGQDPADVLVAAGARGLRRALGVTVPLVDAAVTARLDRWAVHAGTRWRWSTRSVTSPAWWRLPRHPRGRGLVGLVAGRLQLPADLVTATLLDAAAPS